MFWSTYYGEVSIGWIVSVYYLASTNDTQTGRCFRENDSIYNGRFELPCVLRRIIAVQFCWRCAKLRVGESNMNETIILDCRHRIWVRAHWHVISLGPRICLNVKSRFKSTKEALMSDGIQIKRSRTVRSTDFRQRLQLCHQTHKYEFQWQLIWNIDDLWSSLVVVRFGWNPSNHMPTSME